MSTDPIPPETTSIGGSAGSETKSTTLQWFEEFGKSLLWGPASAIMLILGMLFLAREGVFFFFGITTFGTVVSVRVDPPNTAGQGGAEQSSSGKSLLRIRYEYRDGNGTLHSREYAETTDNTSLRLERGERIQLEYLRYSPETSRLQLSTGAPFHWAGLLGLLLLSIGIIAGVIWITQRHEPWFWIERLTRRRTQKKSTVPPQATDYPPEWEGFLTHNIAMLRHLPDALQARWREETHHFVKHFHWEGCAGFVVTEEVKVTIAAQACVMLLGMDGVRFDRVQTILVYPTTFRMRQDSASPGGVVHEGKVKLLGQAWQHGPVILAWDEVLAGTRDAEDGRNVVLHEFAHQLDFLGEIGQLHSYSADQLQSWRTVMLNEYRRLVKQARSGRVLLLDTYGAQNEREFFAVATEFFFEKPLQMRELHAELYRILSEYYGVDTASWPLRSVLDLDPSSEIGRS